MVRRRELGFHRGATPLDGGRGWWREGHDVCGVAGVFAGGQGVQGGGGGEEEVGAEAVVGVDCGGGGEGEFLRGGWRGHGEVVAGGPGDVHSEVWC